LIEKSWEEWTQLRIFAAGIELAQDEPTSQVFGDGQAIAGDSDERGAVKRHHA